MQRLSYTITKSTLTRTLTLSGTWSVPRRNPNFTGRDQELEELQSRLSTQDGRRQRVNVVEVAGMGGVGKTQLVRVFLFFYSPAQVFGLTHISSRGTDSLQNTVTAIFQVCMDCKSHCEPGRDKHDADRFLTAPIVLSPQGRVAECRIL
jgi:hypothetical protein